MKYGKFPGIPLEVEAGIKVEGRTCILPLSGKGEQFYFCDQEITPTSMSLSAIDPSTLLHLKLTVTIPFRPRDAEFSTMPVILFDLKLDRLTSGFRWKQSLDKEVIDGEFFLKIGGAGFRNSGGGEILNLSYDLDAGNERGDKTCKDSLLALDGKWKNGGISKKFRLEKGMNADPISFAWCAYEKPVLKIYDTLCPFRYAKKFKSIGDIVKWAGKSAPAIRENSEKVDWIIGNHNLGTSIGNLMAQTLHSWLINTWWVLRPDGREWFSVWEGSCYFHSTVDVEYTQLPFYLSVWPELLELELDQWPEFGKDGKICLGERGKDTLFMSHDIGQFVFAGRQFYHHEMEVEESTNYILMAFTHWRRTGREKMIRKHKGFITRLMDFVLASDTTGNGIPDHGCANTIDDASPAVQYAPEQVYLGVKSMGAILAGKEILGHLGIKDLSKYAKFANAARQTIEKKGWLKDHYAVALTRTSRTNIVDPWTGKDMGKDIKGWDAHHIYTCNALPTLDMVGFDIGVDDSRIRLDIVNALEKTTMKYGSRHSDYVPEVASALSIPGLVSRASYIGWISMNMLRDMAAAYRGVDCFAMADRYWDWQVTTNSQETGLFFETFYGNNLCFYPRGVVVFGFFEAAAGFKFDVVGSINETKPVRASLKVPLLYFADWKKGKVPLVQNQK